AAGVCAMEDGLDAGPIEGGRCVYMRQKRARGRMGCHGGWDRGQSDAVVGERGILCADLTQLVSHEASEVALVARAGAGGGRFSALRSDARVAYQTLFKLTLKAGRKVALR